MGGREERRRMGWLRERKENEKGKGCRGGGITNISFVASCTLLRCVGQSECNKSEWNFALYCSHFQHERHFNLTT